MSQREHPEAAAGVGAWSGSTPESHPPSNCRPSRGLKTAPGASWTGFGICLAGCIGQAALGRQH
eukprot:354968-Chlamydomonas_euryale.AAC.3